MADNVEQLQKQGVVTKETVEILREMLVNLKISAEKIDAVENLTQNQNIYTKEAVRFNEEFINSMKEQVERVEGISELVEEIHSTLGK